MFSNQNIARAVASVALLFAAIPAGAQITNGSLTGSIANGSVPTGWQTLQGSPDTMNEFNNVGGNFGGFQATPSPSPNGGTWVGMAVAGTFVERFGQTMTGLSIGQTYDVSWYTANFGYFGYASPASVGMMINNILVGTGALHSIGTQWFLESASFTATSTSEDISFRAYGDGSSYISIDGIGAVEADDVETTPEPASMVLVATGLSLVGFTVRRKRAAR